MDKIRSNEDSNRSDTHAVDESKLGTRYKTAIGKQNAVII